jgi:NDP-sugar pyrophosphorylase family protein
VLLAQRERDYLKPMRNPPSNKAMILAAGLGTRLKPLTDKKPKALLEYEGTPLLEHVILKLKDQGFTEIIINVHHFAQQIIDFVRQKKSYGVRIEFSHESEELLDTGGGIANASWFFHKEPFLVYNVDILSNIDLKELMNAHLEKGSIATLAVKERVTSRSLLMDRQGLLKGWRDNRSGETIMVDPNETNLHPIAFSAIHVLDPAIFDLFPKEKRFSIMPFYLELARSQSIYLHRHDRDRWTDMGKLESYT